MKGNSQRHVGTAPVVVVVAVVVVVVVAVVGEAVVQNLGPDVLSGSDNMRVGIVSLSQQSFSKFPVKI